MGGFVEDVIGGVGDLIGGAVDAVGDVIGGIGDMVDDIIPGGWATVGAGALLAMGIVDPTLLGLAEEGALTAEAVGAAGLDAAAVAEGAAAVAPEVAAASASAAASGLSPELIAAANATADPIAALNAAAGFTTADTAYLATIGASPALIAAAEANNAALAAGVGDLGATDASLGAAGQANAANTLPPVVDAVGTPGVGAGTPDPTLLQGMKDLGKAGLESLGLGNMSATQIAALMAAGALAPSVLNALGYTGGAGSKGTNFAPIAIPKVPVLQNDLASTGVGAGLLHATPAYNTTDPREATYYWGATPYIETMADIGKLNDPSIVGTHGWRPSEQPAFDVNAFIRNTINPQWQAASAGSSPALYRPQPTQTAAVGVPVAAPAPAMVPAPVAAPTPVAEAPVVPVAAAMPAETTQTFLVPSEAAPVAPEQVVLPGYPVSGAKVMSGAPLYAADIMNAALPMARVA